MDRVEDRPLTLAEAKARLREAAAHDPVAEGVRADPVAALLVALDLGLLAGGSRPLGDLVMDLALRWFGAGKDQPPRHQEHQEER